MQAVDVLAHKWMTKAEVRQSPLPSPAVLRTLTVNSMSLPEMQLLLLRPLLLYTYVCTYIHTAPPFALLTLIAVPSRPVPIPVKRQRSIVDETIDIVNNHERLVGDFGLRAVSNSHVLGKRRKDDPLALPHSMLLPVINEDEDDDTADGPQSGGMLVRMNSVLDPIDDADAEEIEIDLPEADALAMRESAQSTSSSSAHLSQPSLD